MAKAFHYGNFVPGLIPLDSKTKTPRSIGEFKTFLSDHCDKQKAKWESSEKGKTQRSSWYYRIKDTWYVSITYANKRITWDKGVKPIYAKNCLKVDKWEMIGNGLDKLNEIINSGLFDEGIDKAWEEQLKSARKRGPKVKFAHWAKNNGKVPEWSRGANKALNMEAWERYKESDAYDSDYAEWDVLLERPTGAKEEN